MTTREQGFGSPDEYGRECGSRYGTAMNEMEGYGWGGMEWNTGGLFTHACIRISALGLHGATRSVTAFC
jgi:hypothetical protein